MNQEVLKKITSFCTLDTFPELPCFYCSQETLRLIKSSFRYRELQNQFAEKDFKNINFECGLLLKTFLLVGEFLDHIMVVQAKFSAFLTCRSCKEVVATSGKATVPSKWAKKQGTHVPTRIQPEFFSPPLPIILLYPNYSEALRRAIVRSFSTFFSDPASCGNAIRHSVETLLDDQKIERIETRRDGRPSQMNLDRRIALFEQKFQHAKLLHGIRAIGNEASHNYSVSQDDLLQAYEVLDYILRELYVHPQAQANMEAMSSILEGKYRRTSAGRGR